MGCPWRGHGIGLQPNPTGWWLGDAGDHGSADDMDDVALATVRVESDYRKVLRRASPSNTPSTMWSPSPRTFIRRESNPHPGCRGQPDGSNSTIRPGRKTRCTSNGEMAMPRPSARPPWAWTIGCSFQQRRRSLHAPSGCMDGRDSSMPTPMAFGCPSREKPRTGLGHHVRLQHAASVLRRLDFIR